MRFLEFMVGKRLLEDDLERGVAVLATSPKIAARRLERLANEFLRLAKCELEVPGARWKSAGEVRLLPSGEVQVPELPDRAGILRLELRGPAPSDLVVMLSEHESLQAQDSQESDREVVSELLAGVRFVASFIDSMPASSGNRDLASQPSRATIVRSIEDKAERSGYWLIQSLDGRNALVPNPDAVR